ncbi:MAG: SUMF1/EgtB/PvdO family nonheme iron enzyme [Abditibacteriota bacterium]|nr:SUMF1/EgtB/PvdO family nonheme iron enzyme [Abditibacteriota bacterium]
MIKAKSVALCLWAWALVMSAGAAFGADMYTKSDFIEKEQPQLTAATKRLISEYRRNPGTEAYEALRNEVIKNYNAVLAKKEAKLAELRKETAGKPDGEKILEEMEDIVSDMYATYWSRINSSMLRFTDPRLLTWRVAEAYRYDFVPVMGAGESVYIKRTPVTNSEYGVFVKETGHRAPEGWTEGSAPKGEEDFPVNMVSYEDAEAYCRWLTEKDGVNTCRLPSEAEWELAAGHMPKDADFNNHETEGRVSVEKYAGTTRGAHGAVDLWGNVWEWVAAARNKDGSIQGVKGGSWKSARTDCRTEYRGEGREKSRAFDDVGFRPVMVVRGIEPENKAALSALEAPEAKAESVSGDIVLEWDKVKDASDYQVFEYTASGSLKMLGLTHETRYTVKTPSEGSRYVVQAVSFTAVSDNVSVESSVSST